MRYHYDRRVEAGVDPEPCAVRSDVETAISSCVPIPHRAPRVDDIEALPELIAGRRTARESNGE